MHSAAGNGNAGTRVQMVCAPCVLTGKYEEIFEKCRCCDAIAAWRLHESCRLGRADAIIVWGCGLWLLGSGGERARV